MTYENAEALPGAAALPAVAVAVAAEALPGAAPLPAYGCAPLARRTAPEEGVA